MACESRFFAANAWIAGAWARDVLLSVGADGRWSSVGTGVAADALPAGTTTIAGPVLPGVVNAHSHAFQRAMAGLTERRSAATDDFWSWRDRMYTAANRITPEQLEVIASLLYAEMLAGGYTEVCEFQYLHNGIDGKPYADPLEMSLALVRAAQRSGIGLTLLPTLYMRSGFKADGLRQDQRRFASTPESILEIVHAVKKLGLPGIDAGVAIHSLRAVSPAALTDLAAQAQAENLAVHIHIAEQTQEVDDCLAETGQRPIDWLLDHAGVDGRWNLVHATHGTPAELRGVQAKGAAVVICPATEANLGDGVFDLPAYAAVSGQWSIGSDSHVTRSWPEELRLLEYSQRLTLRQRNIAARISGNSSSAAALFESALAGGVPATNRAMGGIAIGQRADFVSLDLESPALLGVPVDYLLDALVFSSPDAKFDKVYVAGKAVEAKPAALAGAYTQAMQGLWR
jgi:formimidoylglutamate deiminase